MTGSVAVDLSRLPVPDVVETLDYEAILAAMRADLILRAPELAPALAVESDPLLKVLQVAAYREVLLRARINDAARAVLLATATGADLDNIAALFGVQRLVTVPANPTAIPPVPAEFETDAALRARTQLALEGFSTAGPRGAYLYHALSASGQVKDAGVRSPAPGLVEVAVLSTIGDGTPDASLLATVTAALNDENVRPLCDQVQVIAAAVQTYAVTAIITVGDGPDPAVIQAEALSAVTAYVAEVHRIGRAVRRSGLFAALHRPGVTEVTLSAPAADIVPPVTGAAFCAGVTLATVTS